MSYRGEVGDLVETGRRGGVFSFEWRIPDFLSLADEEGDLYQSPVYHACDGRWCFQVYPLDSSRSPPTQVNLILYRLGSDTPETFDVTVGIRGLKGVENKKRRIKEFSKGDTACYWFDFCPRWKLMRWKSGPMPVDVLIITLDMKIDVPIIARDSSTQTTEESKESETPPEEHQHPQMEGVEELQKSLKELLAAGEGSDVLIKVRGKEFPAHRAILRARSAVFQAMFSHDMIEKQSGVVTIVDCEAKSFPAFLKHVYTGSVEMISTENVFSLYTASDKYDLNALKKACTEFMKNHLSVSCICDVIALAVKYSEKQLIEKATEFFCSNTLEIFKTVEWQIFLKENTTIGNELLIKAFSK